tara:strand:+ start:3097 stop:3291 length:195 start_codon:yes stop_codon:yes gene_type:complete
MDIDETDLKFMIRKTIVELFKEVSEGNLQTNQEIELEDCLMDILSNKLNNYRVDIYGVSLREGL